MRAINLISVSCLACLLLILALPNQNLMSQEISNAGNPVDYGHLLDSSSSDQITRISVSSSGDEANGYNGSISADGLYVAFDSASSALVDDDFESDYNVFVHDRRNGTTILASKTITSVSFSTGNGRFPSISGNGRYVVFKCSSGIVVYDMQNDAIQLVTVTLNGDNGGGFNPSISHSGRFVAFVSASSNLVINDTNDESDIFVRDLANGVTERVSVSSSGNQQDVYAGERSGVPSMSADGRYVVFDSAATNLVSNDTNNVSDVFLRDREKNETIRISITSEGLQANGSSYLPTISANGRYIAFVSVASNIVNDDTNNDHDVFLYDRITENIIKISDDRTMLMSQPDLSSDGRFIVYGANRVVLYDQLTGEIKLPVGESLSYDPTISADGKLIAFTSQDDGLVENDTNNEPDVFVVDLAIGNSCAMLDAISQGANTDTDGDGLPDVWEKCGYDADNDGTIDVDLPAIGADPQHKDIFVEVDYMESDTVSRKPSPDAIKRVVDAFNNAPVDNPDKTKGIHLHVDFGKDAPLTWGKSATWSSLSKSNAVAYKTYVANCEGITTKTLSWNEFDQTFKNGNFDKNRQAIFHYNLWSQKLCPDLEKRSGLSRGAPASDFIVSIGSWENATDITLQAGTFMHELGHNLGLCHGGPVNLALSEDQCNLNFKPNYLSVMNYSFQISGLIAYGQNGTMDYSRFSNAHLPDLDEAGQLDETTGIMLPSNSHGIFGTVHFCDLGMPIVEKNADQIDWNCNGNLETAVTYNVNEGYDWEHDTVTGILRSYDDWNNLIYEAGSIGQLGGNFVEPIIEVIDELTEEEALQFPSVVVTQTVFLPLVSKQE